MKGSKGSIPANSSKLSQESWEKVMILVTTKDIFSIIDFEDVFRALDLGLVLFELEDEADDGIFFGIVVVPCRGRGQDAPVLRGLHVRVQGVIGRASDGET